MKVPDPGVVMLLNLDIQLHTLRSSHKAVQGVPPSGVEKNRLTAITCSQKALDCVRQVQVEVLEKGTANAKATTCTLS